MRGIFQIGIVWSLACAGMACGSLGPKPFIRKPAPPGSCNGSLALCDRPFDRVAFPMTHNSMSNDDEGWVLPNQHHPIARQLQDGIRGFMFDTHYWGASGTGDAKHAYLCHANCLGGSLPLTTAVAELSAFLTSNPQEVIVIIFEDYIAPDDTATVLAPLSRFLFTPPAPGDRWPTLGQMIQRNQRLVVFSENYNGPAAWYPNAWNLIHDTPHQTLPLGEFSCAPNRGAANNPLLLVNHWRTPAFDFFAGDTNGDDLTEHLRRCQDTFKRPPNFIGVDFYDEGNLLYEVEQINSESW